MAFPPPPLEFNDSPKFFHNFYKSPKKSYFFLMASALPLPPLNGDAIKIFCFWGFSYQWEREKKTGTINQWEFISIKYQCAYTMFRFLPPQPPMHKVMSIILLQIFID